jgi:hypothetical protein
MRLSPDSWLLAAISLPLTVVTILVWLLVAYGKHSWLPSFMQIFRENKCLSPMRERVENDLESANLHLQTPTSTFEMSPTLCGSRVATDLTIAPCSKLQVA